ncbi:hypothetical protein HanRHA438_Chr12g0540351 [Helianthus annuus]|nr:hypothetical protein HanRHA438_Chr12g0540351 [Helianthus annuus]
MMLWWIGGFGYEAFLGLFCCCVSVTSDSTRLILGSDDDLFCWLLRWLLTSNHTYFNLSLLSRAKCLKIAMLWAVLEHLGYWLVLDFIGGRSQCQ